MALEYFDLRNLRKNHPAWRLMAADSAALVAAFLDSAFREHNRRSLSESDLTMLLEDYLYQLRESEGAEVFPRGASEYLDEWARNDRGWLRKFYPQGSDEAHYDLTPATETALQWLEGLFHRGFVGTESRLYTAIQLLREIATGVEQDRDLRIAELRRRKQGLDDQIAAIEAGDLPLLDARALKERFQQFTRTARELLSDFRAVEHSFRELDRNVRERIAQAAGEKGEMLEQIFGEHDAITDSEQGRSFRAFWDFLMSPSGQEELTTLLDSVYQIEELGDALEDERLRRIHFDWMTAGEQTQRTVARLSQQLRSYLDDKSYYENRRITELLSGIEKRALTLRDTTPRGVFMEIDDCRPQINLPLERPLFSPPLETEVASLVETAETDAIDTSALFDGIVVDRARLTANLESALTNRTQITLQALLERYPLRGGLAELVAYLSLAAENPRAQFHDDITDLLEWEDQRGIRRRARAPQVIFARRRNDE